MFGLLVGLAASLGTAGAAGLATGLATLAMPLLATPAAPAALPPRRFSLPWGLAGILEEAGTFLAPAHLLAASFSRFLGTRVK